MTRISRAENRRKAADTERSIAEAVAEQKAERDAEWKAAQDAHKSAEAARVRFTRDDLLGAKVIRTSIGWRRVVKVNTTTVTVQTPYSWTDRVPFDKVLEVLR